MADQQGKTAILIAGMHRSGTSALTRTLNLMGFDLPSGLMPAREDNERGFWESQKVCDLNDEILEYSQSNWDDWEALGSCWLESSRYAEFRERAIAVLCDEFADSPLFVLKDPRICRLMPLWVDALSAIDVRPVVAMCVRHPHEVAQSLLRRNKSDLAYGQLLWLRHVLEAELGSRYLPRVTVHFDDLLDDWRGVIDRIGAAFKLGWPGRSSAGDASIDAFLDEGQRRRVMEDVEFQLGNPACGWIAETHELLKSWSEGGEQPAQWETLDTIRREFDETVRTFGGLIAYGRREASLARTLEAEAERQAQAHKRKEQAYTREIEIRDRRIGELLASSKEQQAAAEGKAQAYKRGAQAYTREIEIRDNRISELLASTSWRVTAPLRAAGRMARLLRRILRRLLKVAGWLATGQFRLTWLSAMRFYRRRAPHWLTPLVPASIRAGAVQAAQVMPKPRFVPEFQGSPPVAPPLRLAAFYLPQFHPIPENDAWWGTGFTEWTGVRKAKPQFQGHYQPRVPVDGYYDLCDMQTMRRQVELARRYGIDTFCFYFYWFNGKRLLEIPLLNYLADPSLNLSFCLCWANENWTRRWDGRDDQILIGQQHTPADDLAFIEYVSRYFADPRYRRINGRPLLIVYRTSLLPDAAATAQRWRGWCREQGIGEIYLAMVQSFKTRDPRLAGMDAAIEFPWHGEYPTDITQRFVTPGSSFRGAVFDWADYIERREGLPSPPWVQLRGVMPGWDNTPRRAEQASLFHGSSPESYRAWLRSAGYWTLQQERNPDERLIFINAWNEWGEGAYLEADQRHGYAFLQATRDALEDLSHGRTAAAGGAAGSGSDYTTDLAGLEQKGLTKVAEVADPAPFPTLEEPEISVVIPVYGNSALSRRCLAVLSRLTDRRSFEVIVVDDASEDDSADVLGAVEGLRYLRNDRNLGFLLSCNRGAMLARGRYLMLLNNDALVMDGALDELAATFDTHQKVGLVGAKLLFEDGRLQEAGGIVFDDGSAMNYGRGDDPRKPEYNYVRDADYCSGAAIMLPTALWRDLGGFDSYYVRAYYEDTDLAMRVRQAGYRVIYQPFARVLHLEGATAGTNPAAGEKRHQTLNAQRFFRRWRPELQSRHCAPSLHPMLACDRGRRGRVLVIDWAPPSTDHDSGSVDTFNLIRMLLRLDFKVTFYAQRDYLYWREHTDAAQRIGAEMLYTPFVRSFSGHLKIAGRYYDHIIVHRFDVYRIVSRELKEFCQGANIVFNTVDLHHLREARLAELEGSASLAKRAAAIREAELEQVRCADAVVVVSSYEKEQLEREVTTTPIFHLPLIRDIPGPGPAPFKRRLGIGFLGCYLHPPNVDAIVHFVEVLWPSLRAAAPQLELMLGGSDMPPEVKRLGALEGVQAIGYVGDLGGFFNSVRLTVAPLRYGAGAKGKVISSLCHGVPVIASPIAAEGIEFEEGDGLFVAREAGDWVRLVQHLHSDQTAWRNASERGLALMRRNHSMAAGSARLAEILAVAPEAATAAKE